MSKKCNNIIERQPINYNLGNIDVYTEEKTASSYINITDMPSYFTYGKTPIFISILDKLGDGLKSESSLLFEFRDAKGTLLFSDIANIEDISGAAVIYVDIKDERVSKIRNKKLDKISDGIGTLTIAGELEDVPDDWKGNYNYKFTTEIEIRKSSINSSSVVLDHHPTLYVTSSHLDDSTIASKRGSTYNSVIRSYTGIGIDNMNTVGGRIGFIEVSYKSDAFTTEQYSILDTIPIQPVELLTVSETNKIKDTTWVGGFHGAYTAAGNTSYGSPINYWDMRRSWFSIFYYFINNK